VLLVKRNTLRVARALVEDTVVFTRYRRVAERGGCPEGVFCYSGMTPRADALQPMLFRLRCGASQVRVAGRAVNPLTKTGLWEANMIFESVGQPVSANGMTVQRPYRPLHRAYYSDRLGQLVQSVLLDDVNVAGCDLAARIHIVPEIGVC
jgi:hypothetical protein